MVIILKCRLFIWRTSGLDPRSLTVLIFINDNNEGIPREKIKLFADDTNLFIQGPDIRKIVMFLSEHLVHSL